MPGQTPNIMNNKTTAISEIRANYYWGRDGNIIWLKDEGGPHRSLTNDINNCLVEIQTEIDVPINTLQIIYCDSEGNWDGVRIVAFDRKAVDIDAAWLETGRFYFAQGIRVEFYSIGEKCYETTKSKIRL